MLDYVLHLVDFSAGLLPEIRDSPFQERYKPRGSCIGTWSFSIATFTEDYDSCSGSSSGIGAKLPVGNNGDVDDAAVVISGDNKGSSSFGLSYTIIAHGTGRASRVSC